ncbi:MAG: glycosyltransferase [Planctomycetota bacterium]|nr:glycosyltransferase [Planctomycetota bacterium]
MGRPLRVALVTTSPTVRSGIGDYTRHLVPYLREHCDLRVFVEPGAERVVHEGIEMVSVDRLDPRQHDHLLFQLGNERSHGFMARMVRALGGTVMQHDWVLFDMAVAAYPALARGGLKGHLLAVREGGVDQLRTYARNWLARRRQRRTPATRDGDDSSEGGILSGWHEPEPNGRWTDDCARVRIPDSDVSEIVIALRGDTGRRVRLVEPMADGRLLDELIAGERGTLTGRPARPDRPLVAIETDGITVTREQRLNGDSRRLGSFVEGIRWKGSDGWKELDLGENSTDPIMSVVLARDRFALPLNRSVVRFGDSFLVHSRYVADLILTERNARTPIGIVRHGAERLWRDEDRRAIRGRLGLPEAWASSFLVTSFGGVQPHKRVDKLLAAVAEARENGPDVRLAMVGGIDGEGFDPPELARRLGIAEAVHFTGFVAEEEIADWIHAGDASVNLRGPTSGGTSGGIFRTLAMGRFVIATGAAEQAELPDSCVVKIPLGAGEVPALARELVALHGAKDRRAALERGAREFVEGECHWSHVARRCAEHLQSFPAPRAKRQGTTAVIMQRLRLRKISSAGPSAPSA